MGSRAYPTSGSGDLRTDRDMTEVSVGNVFGNQAWRVRVSTSVSLFACPPWGKRGTPRFLSMVSPPLLVPSDLVQRPEDVAAVLHGVVLGAVGSLRSNHVENLVLVCRRPPRVAHDVAPGRSADPLPEAQDGVNVGLEVPPLVPAEDELVSIVVDMLVADTVVCPVAPPLKFENSTSCAGGASTALRLMAWCPRSGKRLYAVFPSVTSRLPTAVLSRMKACRLSRLMLTMRCRRHRAR